MPSRSEVSEIWHWLMENPLDSQDLISTENSQIQVICKKNGKEEAGSN